MEQGGVRAVFETASGHSGSADRRVRNGWFARFVATKALPAFTLSGVGLLAAAMAARRLPTEEFALYLLVLSVTGLASVVVDFATSTLGLQLARRYTRSSIDASFRRIRSLLVLPVSVGSGAAMLLLHPGSKPTFLLLAVGQVLVVVWNQDWYLIANGLGGRLSVARLAVPLLSIVALYWHARVEFLLLGRLYGLILSTSLVRRSAPRFPIEGSSVRTREVVRLTVPILMSTVFSQLYASRLDHLFLRQSEVELARYGAAYTLYAGALLPLLTALAAELPTLRNGTVSDHAIRSSALGKFRLRVGVLAGLSCVLVAFLGSVVQPLLFGRRLAIPALTILWLAVCPLAVGFGAFAGYPLFALNRNRRLMPVAFAGALANLVTNALFSGRYGATGAAFAMVAAESSMAGANWLAWKDSLKRKKVHVLE